jgi:hypothetical protein
LIYDFSKRHKCSAIVCLNGIFGINEKKFDFLTGDLEKKKIIELEMEQKNDNIKKFLNELQKKEEKKKIGEDNGEDDVDKDVEDNGEDDGAEDEKKNLKIKEKKILDLEDSKNVVDILFYSNNEKIDNDLIKLGYKKIFELEIYGVNAGSLILNFCFFFFIFFIFFFF